MAEILFADDDNLLRRSFTGLLEGEGYVVRTAKNGEEAVVKFREKIPDLVLLDVDMPKLNGFRACEEIRRLDATVPVVFFTGKDSEVNDLKSMGVGGDYFVSKGADSAILLARIRRALERVEAAAPAAPAAADGEQSAPASREAPLAVRIGQTFVDTSALTRTEVDVLRILASRRGEYFTVEELISALRGNGFACEDTMLYVHIANLRRKLGKLGSAIESVRLRGYRLV